MIRHVALLALLFSGCLWGPDTCGLPRLRLDDNQRPACLDIAPITYSSGDVFELDITNNCTLDLAVTGPSAGDARMVAPQGTLVILLDSSNAVVPDTWMMHAMLGAMPVEIIARKSPC